MPMSCEFTPERERQRIQHLVSDAFCTSDSPAASTTLGQRGLGTRFNQQPLVWEMLVSSLECTFPVLFSILLLGVPVRGRSSFGALLH